MRSYHPMPFGAEVTAAGVRFAIWAPAAREAAVHVDGRVLPMQRGAEGFFTAMDPKAEAGSRYAFRFDTTDVLVPDPASRFNPDDVHDPSEVVAPTAYEWRDAGWRGRPWPGAVVYELHVGTFTPEGTYAAAMKRLDHLAALGVTALELMPLAAAPGRFNWGYDGVLPFAPQARFGRPEELKRFVDAAHESGLMVLLDVVYNHFGPDGNYLGLYAPQFFTARHHTPWGNAINFDDVASATVRRFFTDNALYWLEEYHFDGLRLDAVHAILDDSEPSFLRDLAAAVRELRLGRPLHLVLENDLNDATLLSRGAGGEPATYTAQWNDDFHHALLVLLTGDTRGHYRDYGDPAAHLLRILLEGFAYQGEHSAYRGAPRGTPSRRLPPEAFVSFLQNHDQIGNRPDAARLCNLVDPEPLAAAEILLALLPTPILMFMGDEFHAPSPFPFFCDFGGDLGVAVTEGRRKEFASLWRDVDCSAVPGPTTAEARAAAVLDWELTTREPHAGALRRQRERLRIRAELVAPRLPAQPLDGSLHAPTALTARWRLRDGKLLCLAANLGAAPLASPPPNQGAALLATHALDDGPWPPWLVRWSVAER
jgi:malto-oligosyltrehalose trehalohydrolase